MGKTKSKKLKHHSSASSDSSSSSDSDTTKSTKEKRKLRKLKKKLKREQRKTEKLLKKKLKKEKERLKKEHRSRSKSDGHSRESSQVHEASADIPIELMEKSKAMAPMTKEEWEKRQSVVRRVLDDETGRYRLIKGDGEVLEEIVSRDRHKEINKMASQADGAFFQFHTTGKQGL